MWRLLDYRVTGSAKLARKWPGACRGYVTHGPLICHKIAIIGWAGVRPALDERQTAWSDEPVAGNQIPVWRVISWVSHRVCCRSVLVLAVVGLVVSGCSSRSD